MKPLYHCIVCGRISTDLSGYEWVAADHWRCKECDGYDKAEQRRTTIISELKRTVGAR